MSRKGAKKVKFALQRRGLRKKGGRIIVVRAPTAWLREQRGREYANRSRERARNVGVKPVFEGDWIGENEARNYYVNRYAYQIVVVDKRRYWVRNLSYGFASGFLRRLALVLDECFAGWYDINEETCGRVVIRIPEGHTLEIAQETFRRCTGESLFIHADMQLPSVA